MTDLKYNSEEESKENTIEEKLIASSLDSSSSETVRHDFTKSKLSKIFLSDELNQSDYRMRTNEGVIILPCFWKEADGSWFVFDASFL